MFADPLAEDAPWPQAWTVASPLSFEDVGLHSGQFARLTVRPAPPGHGLVFQRVDLPGAPRVPARIAFAIDSPLCTTLEAAGGARVSTVEHLLAALWGLGVSDALLALAGPEVPILDGSALPYVAAIAAAGVTVHDAARPIANLPAAGTFDAAIGPPCSLASVARDACSVGYTVDYAHPLVGLQHLDFAFSPATFATDIAPARTFALLHQVTTMQAAGLARGGSTANALVIGDDGFSSPPRFADEPVRHKILDLLGDMALLGVHWRGHLAVMRGGHRLHLSLARQLAAQLTPA